MKLVRVLQGEESKAKNRCYLFSLDLTWPLKSKGNGPLCGLGAHSVESTEHPVPFLLLPCEGLELDSQWFLHLPATLHFTDLLLINLKSVGVEGWGGGGVRSVNSPALVTCLAKLLCNQVSEFRVNRVLGDEMLFSSSPVEYFPCLLLNCKHYFDGWAGANRNSSPCTGEEWMQLFSNLGDLLAT